MINPFSLASPLKLYAALGLAIILSLAVAVHLYHDRGVRSERDRAVSDLIAYKAQQQALTDTKRLENAQKKADADSVLKKVDAERRLALEKLGLANTTTDKLRKALEDDKIIINRAINRADQLRVKTISDTTSLPQVPNATALPAEVGADCDSVLARVTRAAQDTTINYNSLYDSWAKSCAIYGCQ